MVRQAKAKAKAAAAQVRQEQGAEPETEPNPVASPVRKEKKQMESMPEPEVEYFESGIDIRIPHVRTLDQKKKGIGLAIQIALTRTASAIPKKPRGYSNENWTTLKHLLHANAKVLAEGGLGTKEQADYANGLATLLTDITYVLQVTNEDSKRYHDLIDLGILLVPLAEELYGLHLISPDRG